MNLIGRAAPVVVVRVGRGVAGCPCALDATAAEVLRALGMERSAELHARGGGGAWTADEWRAHIAEERAVWMPAVRAVCSPDDERELDALEIEHKLYGALLDAGRMLPTGEASLSVDAHGRREDALTVRYADALLARVGPGFSTVGAGAGALPAGMVMARPPSASMADKAKVQAAGWPAWVKTASWVGLGVLGARWLGWGWMAGAAAGGGAALVADVALGPSSTTGASQATAPSHPLGRATLTYWRAYRDALDAQFGRGALAEGVGDYVYAIDKVSDTMRDFNAAREEDQAKFKSAVSFAFGKSIGDWTGKVMEIISSLATPGGDSWDPKHLDQAAACANATVKEGYPLVAHSVNSLSHRSYLGVKYTYCVWLDDMRALPKGRQDALRALWSMALQHAKQLDVAFLMRYSLMAFVDDSSAEAHKAYESVIDQWLSMTQYTSWGVAFATLVAVHRGRSVGAEIDRVLRRVNERSFSSGPDGTQTPRDVLNQIGFVAEVATGTA